MQFCNPGLLGPSERVRASASRARSSAATSKRRERLRRIVRPFVLRRLKSDPDVAPDLPDKIVSSVVCPLTPEQATLYRATVDEVLEQIEAAQGMARRGTDPRAHHRAQTDLRSPGAVPQAVGSAARDGPASSRV